MVMNKVLYADAVPPEVTCESDYRDIRIYINGILHIVIPRASTDTSKDSLWLQSYYTGSRKRRFYYIEVRSGDHTDYYGYEDIEIWKKILQLLDDNI